MAAEQCDGIGASVLAYTDENLGSLAIRGVAPTAAAEAGLGNGVAPTAAAEAGIGNGGGPTGSAAATIGDGGGPTHSAEAGISDDGDPNDSAQRSLDANIHHAKCQGVENKGVHIIRQDENSRPQSEYDWLNALQ